MIRKLNCFKISLKGKHIFNDPDLPLPPFLAQNLQDEARVVKMFKHDHRAYLKIFYFQFFKLCFEADHVDYDSKINKFIETLETHLHYLSISAKFCKDLPPEAVKSIFFEFLELMSECREPVQETLNRYPVACDIFVNFWDRYLQEQTRIDTSYNNKQIFEELCELLEVDIVEYDSCFQFMDTQIYIYTHNQNQIYLIYIDSKGKKEGKPDSSASNSSKMFSCSDTSSQDMENRHLLFNDLEIEQQSDSEIKKVGHETMETFANTKQVQGISLKLSNIQAHHQRPEPYPCDITNQFTNTVLLQKIMEPYRSSIKSIKMKARAERKALQSFFH